ncbi:MAG: hypothetical protein HOK30_22895 [Rhodospirillaceae bacterium]|nr:hypothetical protein [Rhodospirillaceae bacterium]MBT5048680.1 hypothetical protein [Rhodospirillaceae bacterium]MBT6430534.1 hypothetical protein [Rhodospirillaceae bacterium]
MREITERLRPPRFLWVPFELGRPFGAPDEPEFQTEVLRATLALLEREEAPPILDDFPVEAPGGDPAEMTGWTCPVSFPPAESTDEPPLLANILAEITSLTPWHALAHETRGRTSVGSARMAIEDSARFLHALLEGHGTAENPVASLSPGQIFLGASEDMRTFYMEAATAKPGPATSHEVADWFWSDTAAGELLLALRPVCLESPEKSIRRAAARQLVPRAQIHRLVRS